VKSLRRADLHVHSTASDGVQPPSQLVTLAWEGGLAGLALTDHDNLAGVEEAQKAADAQGLVVWPGVELSTVFLRAGERHEVHLLGLFLDGLSPKARQRLEDHLARRREERRWRGQEMVARLERHGLALTWEEVEAQAAGGAVGRPHVARALVARGYASSLEDAFARYLTPGKPGYVPQPDLPTVQAVQWVREAGGAAVWAHPGLGRLSLDEVPWLGELDGVEVDHPWHAPHVRAQLREGVTKRGLVATGGSDCHGSDGRERPGLCTTPWEAVEELRRRAQRRRG
jgi:predicted metal-dependent phosphoesterase TrpH